MNRKNSSISLNCSLLAPPTTTLCGGHTPNTPEILNTIVNITSQMGNQFSPTNLMVPHPIASPLKSETMDVESNLPKPSNSETHPMKSLSIVEDFKSQFIKEGLKMKVKKNLKIESEDSLQKILHQNIKQESEAQSPEDEIRRRRRRERNKVAAEKCRNKKKKETLNLFSESEIVERANVCYKEDIARLEAEQRHLMSILANHLPACKIGRDSAASGNCWNFDSSQTFRIPSLPIGHQSNNGVMEVDTEDNIDSDYSAAQSDCQRTDEDPGSVSELQSCHLGRSGSRQERKYSNFSYPACMMAGGYADSVCAVI